LKSFPSEKIRNVALVGHGGSGKTTLTEALLFVSGAIPRLGKVEDGNTVCDFDPEEARRSISVSLAMAPFEHDGHKVNVIDTPGYADFVSDMAAALRAADLAIFVVSAVEGVEVQTEAAWRLADERGLPRAVFVNKLDRERASFSRTLDDLKAKFGTGIAPLELPIGEENDFRGVIDLLTDSAITYEGETGKGKEGPVPDDMEPEEHRVHDSLVEGIVVADDDLMERYLSDEKIEVKELEGALAKGIAEASVFPVLCGSGAKLIGVDRLARFLVDEGPAPQVDDGPPVAFVFKTVVDPYVGRVNLFKVLQGTVKTDAHLVNNRSTSEERLHQLSTMRGKEQESTSEVPAGDIAAVAKLSDTTTGDVLGARGAELDVEPFTTPEPVLSVAIRPKSKGDEDKLATALHRLQDEDPALRVERNSETKQTLLRGMGETHVSIAIERLHRKLGVETDVVKVPFRETITEEAEAEGKYKKQTGGHGQFGVAFVRVRPLERGAGFEFVDKIVGGAIPRQFIPAVEKGVVETMQSGGVFGFPVVDVQVECFDGKYHSVDSSEMSFKMAGSLGFKEAMAKAGPILLEPISELVVIAPEASQGDIMGDLNSKRGRIQGASSIGKGEVEIVAMIPTSEILRYAIDLRSMTGGRGRFEAKHSHYDPVPAHLVDKLTAADQPAKT
jgi:elongation factor G